MTGTLTPTMDQAEPKRARLKTDRRREQCRQNQARYRKRQGLRIISLEKAVIDLQQQIRRYELQRRSLIHQTVDPRDASVKTVIELFRLFRHGLDVGRTNPSVVEMSSGQTSRSPRLEKQLAFIRAAVAEDVRVDDERGQDSFIEQVERFTKFFDGSRIHSHVVENVVVGPEGTTIVHVRLELDLTITTTTIRQVFPHLGTCLKLKWTLLGHRMRCSALMIYLLNDKHAIASVDGTVDFTTGLLAVLSIDEVGFVLQKAKIRHDVHLLGNGQGTQRVFEERREATV